MKAVTVQDLAEIMLSLQQRGCHNINLVSPSHIVPQIIEAIYIASRIGLKIPKDVYVNIMAQYYPEHKAYGIPELSRRITGKEYGTAVEAAKKAGLTRYAAHDLQ
ncbi:MAG: hypothetical protein ACYCYE_00095 [Clostridia bacterium]